VKQTPKSGHTGQQHFTRHTQAVNGDMGEVGSDHFHNPPIGRVALGVDLDADGDGGAANTLQVGVKTHQVTDRDPLFEHKLVHGHGLFTRAKDTSLALVCLTIQDHRLIF
jgi:hypothetical protein